MADTVVQKVIDVLITAAGVGDAVRGRVSDLHPSQVAQPSYPSVTIHRANEGYTSRHGPFDYTPLLISVYSKISTDEAVNVQKAIKTALHCQSFQRGTVAFTAYAGHTPVTSYSDTGEKIFMAHVTYEVQSIGA